MVTAPGTYEVPVVDGGRSYTIRGKHPSKKFPEQSPGPGDYSLRKQGTNIMVSISVRNSNGNFRTTNQDAPAPGTYNTRTKPGADAPKISLSARDKIPNYSGDNPGPGTYNVHQTLASPTGAALVSAPHYSMGNKTVPINMTVSGPGPGQYEAMRTMGTGMKKTMGERRAVKNISQINTPGPGAYSVKAPLGSQRAAIVNSRVAYAPPRNTPGPAEYFVPEVVGNDMPAYTLRGRFTGGQPILGGESPGPGKYDVASTIGGKKSLKAGFADRTRMKHPEITPGPIYDPNFKNKPAAPKQSFGGGDARDKKIDITAVGPGMTLFLSFTAVHYFVHVCSDVCVAYLALSFCRSRSLPPKGAYDWKGCSFLYNERSICFARIRRFPRPG